LGEAEVACRARLAARSRCDERGPDLRVDNVIRR
jgi:hypothetical protein